MGYVESSKAVQYAASKGWSFRTNDSQIIVEECPICKHGEYKFYMNYTDKDGVWDCKHCGEKGNLYDIRTYCGDRMENVTSLQDVASSQRRAAPLPDIEAAHRALMDEAATDADNTALEYLVGRGYSKEVIEKYKLGLVTEWSKRWLVYPYLKDGKPIYAKFRTLPPDTKEFRGVAGRESPLFNQDVLHKNMEELLLCEGEADTLSCISNGITQVVGIPGANIKKASWIKLLDDLQPQNIYILYDNDRVGQAAAQEMAARIGIEKVRNIRLPEFTWMDGEEEKPGKDINEWFRAGHTLEEFGELKSQAKPFDVDGIQSVGEVIEEIRDIISTKGSLEPQWRASAWESLNRKLKGYEKGDLVGILAEEKRGKTTFAMNILDFLNDTYNEAVLMYCQEMQPQRMVRKWIAMSTETEDKDITLETVDQALAVAANRKSDYLFGYTKSNKRQDVFDTIRQAVRRYGVKFVCFDNLQLLCRSFDHFAQETSVTTKEFKQLAMELGIVIFLIMQPNAVKEGEIVNSRKVYGSSAPGKDVDAMICLHRSREGEIREKDFAEMHYMEVEENFSPELLTRVDLSRYTAGGVTTLLFDGAKSKVRELSTDQIEQKRNSVGSVGAIHPAQFEAA